MKVKSSHLDVEFINMSFLLSQRDVEIINSHNVYDSNRKISCPNQSFTSRILFCNGDSSFLTKTLLAFSTSPKPPTLLGIIPIICGGTRWAAIMSSRLTFLMFRNSSFAATSDSGMIWMPSFFPLGEYINRLRKLPGPLALFIAWRMLFTSSWF